jgi:hypothetical protein
MELYLPTYYSAFSFGFVAVYTQNSWMPQAFTILMGVSILAHSVYAGLRINPYSVMFIELVDKVTAHYITFRTMYNAVTCENQMQMGVWFYYASFIYVAYLWYVRRIGTLPHILWQRWHVTIHFASALGAFYLYRADGCVPKTIGV